MTQEQIEEFLRSRPRRLHLLGVSGSGMSGLAALLLALGHEVNGSDRAETAEVMRLSKKGLRFLGAHAAEHVQGVDAVIYSSAVKKGNAAWDAAEKRGIPLLRRAEVLAAMMRGKRGVIVGGMHGKTTTSALAAHVLREAGLHPSHYVGAEIPILGSNARWDGDGELFVAEGDESDGTLVLYEPAFSVVLNIEPEHLDHYASLEEIDGVFLRLVQQTRERVIYCADDAGAARVCGHVTHAVSYGESESADYRVVGLRMEHGMPRFRVRYRGQDLGEFELGIMGKHNALNACAVIALAREIGAEQEVVARALKNFVGARRRFETLYKDDVFQVVDDYGHHPTEVAATLAACRLTGARRTVVMFQPHRYTRTRAFAEEFGRSFKECDILVVTEIYSAGETALPGVSGELIADSARRAGHGCVFYEPVLKKVPLSAGPMLEEGDLILSLGAGNIHEAGRRLAADLALRKEIKSVMGAGVMRLYEPIARHTTLRVGGPARFWVEPETEEGFVELVRFCSEAELPLLVLGRGSNVLVRDGGWPGVVARLGRGDFLRCEVDGDRIIAGAGVRFKQVAAVARQAGLEGFEWMEGIPGSVGGGLRMNAGAMGWQTFDHVVSVRFCDCEGNVFTREPREMEVRYREVPLLRQAYALSAVFQGRPGDKAEIDERMAASARKRKETQPAAASAGCIFKNPREIPAGRLIDELGFKGRKVGGARVSDVHANFLVNDGDARASDFLKLIEEIRTAARTQRGIELETEVQILGEEEW